MAEATKEPTLNKKFELVHDDFIEVTIGKKLYRIRALINFGKVRAGELGGYIEKEENLSQLSHAWVGDKALVYENARVLTNAQVSGNARVHDHACVWRDAQVSDGARIHGEAVVTDYAQVSGNVVVSDIAQVYDYARISGGAMVSGEASIYGNARVSGNAMIYHGAQVSGNAQVSGGCISSHAKLLGDAWVSSDADLFWFSNIVSSNSILTAYRTRTGIELTHDSFRGSPEDFIKIITTEYGDSHIVRECQLLIKLAKSRWLADGSLQEAIA